ncbi:UNVERIFIED_CONTAM: Purine permease 21 [Sesamum radiatum]|uniref:Purine permease 21 n=2 Tax=Sesamum TaxID=4181 RepID=A0AAW2KHW7_SESRA
MLYTIGLQYLPVTTYTLICASQLGFNAVFSYFLNRQKFTPYIVNSLVLLTISSVLLVFQTDPGDSNKTTKNKYVIGFICTLAASAGYALMLSLTQLAFHKVIKKETLRAVIDMTIYQSVVATGIIVIGLFASGEWRTLNREMEEYKLGKVSYVMNLLWTAISWQAFSVGCVGLIFKVSSLFSNVISILGLPVAPVLAVIFLHDKLTGLKAVAMLLAMWGFVSYMYQHYLDDLKMKEKRRSSEEGVSEVALVTDRG